MVVFVHSLGSLWQEKNLSAGGTRIWNTTGIRAGSRICSYAVVVGQIKLAARARVELSGIRKITGGAWTATELIDFNDVRKLALLCRASRAAVADWHLVTITESLVGELQMDSWGRLADGPRLVFQAKISTGNHAPDAAIRVVARLNRERGSDRTGRKVQLERLEVVTRCATSGTDCHLRAGGPANSPDGLQGGTPDHVSALRVPESGAAHEKLPG
jgi:hypothetical protein